MCLSDFAMFNRFFLYKNRMEWMVSLRFSNHDGHVESFANCVKHACLKCHSLEALRNKREAWIEPALIKYN